MANPAILKGFAISKTIEVEDVTPVATHVVGLTTNPVVVLICLPISWFSKVCMSLMSCTMFYFWDPQLHKISSSSDSKVVPAALDLAMFSSITKHNIMTGLLSRQKTDVG